MSNIIKKISSIEPEIDVESAIAKERKSSDSSYLKLAKNDDPITEDNAIGKNITLTQPKERSNRWITLTIILLLCAWLACIGFTVFNLQRTNPAYFNEPFNLLNIGILGFIPLLILALTGYGLRKLAEISQDATALNLTAQQLITPDQTVLSKTSIMARKISSEVDAIDNRMDQAVARMNDMKDMITEQIQEIEKNSYMVENRIELAASRVVDERTALETLAALFDQKLEYLSKTVSQQTELLASSTREAEQKIQEARISVEGAAEQINASSDIVRTNSLTAVETITSNNSELTKLSTDLQSNAQKLDDIYQKHAADLKEMLGNIQSEQENLNSSLETRLQNMRDLSLSAQVSAGHLNDASHAGQKTIEALSQAARVTDSAVKQRFAEMEDMVKYSNSRAESITEKATRRVQDSLSQTRKEIARIEYDMITLQDKLTSKEGLLKSKENSTTDIERIAEDVTAKSEPPSNHILSPNKVKKGFLGLRPMSDEKEHTAEVKQTLNLRPAPEMELKSPQNQMSDYVPTVKPIPRHEEISIAAPNLNDIERPDPDLEIKHETEALMRRTIPNINSPNKEDRSWWRTMFGRDNLGSVSATDERLQTMPPASSDKNVISVLSNLGLSPAAIVDEGCIVEAVDTRINRGPYAMSEVTAKRLLEPVKHLQTNMAQQEGLKENLTQFARNFHIGLTHLENDREALRRRLESDAGRAFLLCDAALNMTVG